MKSILTKWLPLAFLLLLVAGFCYLAFTDMDVSQSPVENRTEGATVP